MGTGLQSHHFKLFSPLYICGTDAATKFNFCTQMHYGRLLPADQKLCRNVAGIAEYSEKFTPQMCYQMKKVK